MKSKNILALGDITIDAFIDLETASVHCDIDTSNCKICMDWASKIPFKKQTIVPAVGNSPNAAVSFARLGHSSSLISFVGEDKNGEECIEVLKKEGINTSAVVKQKGKNTNYHYVLSYDSERTILIKHETFDYSIPKLSNTPEYMYLSSLAENSLEFHKEIANFVKQNNIKLVFQPGTFQIKLGYTPLKEIYEISELFFCNKDEAKRILETNDNDIKNLLQGIFKLGPKIPVITDGTEGAFLLHEDKAFHLPAYPDIAPPVDRTGAGDSFSSTFTAFYASGMSPTDSLLRAPINSMSVVQHIGAQKGLLNEEQINKYLESAPEEYKVSEI